LSAAPDAPARATWEWVPPYDATHGDIAAEVGELVGLPPDPDQRRILDAMFAYDPTTMLPVCFEVGVAGPRQNIKTSTLEVAALTDLFVFDVSKHIWTAHLFKTAHDAFVDMTARIDGVPDLRRRCRPHRISNGKESIELLTGERIEFHARSKGGGRGSLPPPKRITLDEALFLVPTDMGALLPTLATMPDAQVRLAGSAGMAASAVWRAVRNRGRAGNDPRLAWFEWAADRAACGEENCSHLPPGRPDCALDRPDLLAQSNPALGRRITMQTLADMRRALSPEEFAREFLSWWEDPEGIEDKLPAEVWEACKDAASQLEGVPVFGIDTTPDRRRTSLVVCGPRPGDERLHVEVVRNDPGLGWIDDSDDLKSAVNIMRRAGARIVVVDGKSAAVEKKPTLEAAGFTVVVTGLQEMAQACALLVELAAGRKLAHLGQHELAYAIAGASTRDVGDGMWAWSRRLSSADISPLVGATEAVYGYMTRRNERGPILW
jgi:hypothetical protein